MASIIAGCAAPQTGTRSVSNFGGKVDKSNIGVATKALAALDANDYADGRQARRAGGRENSPNDAGFRALLGNAYFAAGRFASAEAAYRDSLQLYHQPAAGHPEARARARSPRARTPRRWRSSNGSADMLDPADYGLALALAGQPQEAVAVLEPAARQAGADARVRQNLALAYAFAGDWAQARTSPPRTFRPIQLDARIQTVDDACQARTRPSDQVAALIGVQPAAGDPGQPIRLALRTRSMLAWPRPLLRRPRRSLRRQRRSPSRRLRQQPSRRKRRSLLLLHSRRRRQSSPAAAPAPAAGSVASRPVAATAVAEAPAALGPKWPDQEAASRKRPRLRRKRPASPRGVERANGNSTAVVQLGAYGSPPRVPPPGTAPRGDMVRSGLLADERAL